MKTYLMCAAVIGAVSLSAGTASAQHGHSPVHRHPAPHHAVHHNPIHHHHAFASPYPGGYTAPAPIVYSSPRIVIGGGYSSPAVGFGGSVGYASPYSGYSSYASPVRGSGHGVSSGGSGHHHYR